MFSLADQAPGPRFLYCTTKVYSFPPSISVGTTCEINFTRYSALRAGAASLCPAGSAANVMVGVIMVSPTAKQIGATDQRKKDYAPVVEAFTMLYKNTSAYPLPVELYLLGNSSGAYGQQITVRLDALQSPGFTCFHYSKDVPVDTFDTILYQSHFILSPLRVKNITQIYEEIYGKTKFTASIGTIIKYGHIGIFPSAFEYDSAFELHLLKYKDGVELSAVLRQHFLHPAIISDSLSKMKLFLADAYHKDTILYELEAFIERNRT